MSLAAKLEGYFTKDAIEVLVQVHEFMPQLSDSGFAEYCINNIEEYESEEELKEFYEGYGFDVFITARVNEHGGILLDRVATFGMEVDTDYYESL